MTLAWTSHLQAWFPQYCSECNVTNVDLWIMASDWNIYIKIVEGIDVTSTLSYTWTVDIGTAQVASQSVWTFRFIPANTDWSGGSAGVLEQNIASPEFNISSAVTTTSKAAVSTSSTPSTPSKMTTTTTSSSTPFAIPSIGKPTTPSTSTSISASAAQSPDTLQSSSTLGLSTSFTTTYTSNAASSSTSDPVPAASNSRKLSTGQKQELVSVQQSAL
ncbi:hypothetical protein NA56DRAFT_494499 [Hyaloscypha hepaticicola]|uniref:Uncharacterized protein n=1 Tax=Hyaloscypha hepaticicola TaxID=2082293 RepID=A0A2J6QEG9_9HELO|nr:hypothetical protein NA56DRAFT_494499 [Hyaloscypha hepaticicola]